MWAFMLFMMGCQPSMSKDELRISYFEACRNATLRICRWEMKCIDQNIKPCSSEAETFANIAGK